MSETAWFAVALGAWVAAVLIHTACCKLRYRRSRRSG